MFETAALAVSALIVGVAKAGFGAGVGILAVPLMTLALGPEKMLGVLLPVLILGDVLSIVHYPGVYDRRSVAMILPGCAAGVAVGACVLGWFRSVPDGGRYLGGAIGFLCVVFVSMQAVLLIRRGWKATAPPGGAPRSPSGRSPVRDHRVGADACEVASPESPPYRPAIWHGVLVGGGAGLTSTLSHGAGPIVAMFLLPQRLGQRVYVGTTLVYFLFGNLLKLGPFVWQGLVTKDTLQYLLYLGPLVLAGTLLGKWLNRRIPARTFSVVIYALVFAAGIKLVAGLLALLC